MSYNSTDDGPVGEIIDTSSAQNTPLPPDDSNLETNTTNSVKPVGSENDAGASSDLETQPLIRGQLLSPDDPLVSPLNLYYIRALKLTVQTLWWINCVLFFVLLLSDFVSIPGLNNRGRSFLEIDLVLLCALTNLLSLWCFVIPSYYERIWGYISAALFLVDIIVVLSVKYLRHQYGGMGNILLLWTFATLLFNSFVDFKVQEAKEYQEIRYCGRPETRKSFYEAIVISIKFVIKLVLFVVVWNISLSLWLSAFDTHEKPPGKMVSVHNDQFKLHLSCYGDMQNGSQPIVLVEGGQTVSGEEFGDWVEELYDLNKIERFCIYDRPGYGFSDSAPLPVSVSIIIDYLQEMLSAEGISGPFTLLGFDVGGLYSRVFAYKNPGSVLLIVFVDSWSEDLLKLKPFPKPESYKFREFELMTTGTGFKLWFRGLISPLGFVTNLHWFLHPKRYSSKARIYGADMVYQLQYLRARLQEQITALILSYNEVAGAHLGDIPTYIVSSDYLIKRSKNWGNWQRQLTKLSTDSREWNIVENSNHFIWESGTGRKALQQVLVRAVTDQ